MKLKELIEALNDPDWCDDVKDNTKALGNIPVQFFLAPSVQLEILSVYLIKDHKKKSRIVVDMGFKD